MYNETMTSRHGYGLKSADVIAFDVTLPEKRICQDKIYQYTQPHQFYYHVIIAKEVLREKLGNSDTSRPATSDLRPVCQKITENVRLSGADGHLQSFAPHRPLPILEMLEMTTRVLPMPDGYVYLQS